MTRLLVIGKNGQLGWEVTRRAARAGHGCVGLARAELDIADRAAVLDAIDRAKPGVVVNAAAYTAVDKAESEPDAAFAANRDGPGHLAEACERGGIPLIHISTDYVYDGSKAGAYVEDDPVAPLGVYGKSKLAGEEAVIQRCARHVILRTAWVYGVHGHNFVKTMLRLGRERDRLRVVDDQQGSPTFAGDLAEAILTIAGRLGSGRAEAAAYGVFHCAGNGAATWCGFARRIFEVAAPALGRVPEVEAIGTADYPTPARRPANSVLDCRRLAERHGIALRQWDAALEEALAEMLSVTPAPQSTWAPGGRTAGGQP